MSVRVTKILIIIDKGTQSGLSVNMAVISINNGLIGRIVEIGPNWSKVLLITDADSSVSSLNDRTRELAVTKGTKGDPVSDKYGFVKLTYLATDADIITGDIITTSGFGGVFPKGILIGKVKEVKLEANGLTKYAHIEPASDLKRLEEVVVIKGQRGVR